MGSTATSRAPRRVLVCEDAEDARFLLGEMLRAHELEVVEAGLGTDAIEIVLSGAVDVALIDIGLPDVNGFEVAKRIRQNRAMRHVRLIAVTGYGTVRDRVTARESGFDHHLLKPVSIDALLAAIAATAPCDAPSG